MCQNMDDPGAALGVKPGKDMCSSYHNLMAAMGTTLRVSAIAARCSRALQRWVNLRLCLSTTENTPSSRVYYPNTRPSARIVVCRIGSQCRSCIDGAGHGPHI